MKIRSSTRILSTAGRVGVALLATVAWMGNGAAQQVTDGSGIEVQDCVVRFAVETKIPALESGPVAEINVARNEMVEAGALIARLDETRLLNQKRKAYAYLNSAKKEALDNSRIQIAKSTLAEAKAELDTSISIRSEVRGAVPQSQVRKLEHAVEHRKAELALAERLQRQAEDEVEIREAELSQIDFQLQNLRLKSPIRGVLLEVTRSAGEWVEQGEPVATVGRIDRLHVYALLNSEKISPAVCRGLPVSVHWVDPASDAERSLRGKVLSVDPQMLPGGRFRLHAEIVNRTVDGANSQWLLQPGAEVRMKVYASASTAHNSSRSLQR